MAHPTQTAKPSVDLASNPASSGPRVSRIRRDPPPAAKEIVFRDRDESDRSAVVVGILAFALAIFVIILAFGIYSGWSPREYTIEVTTAE
ncbi:MAG: hypothetical protein ACR2KH_00440 [Sphingomicrobium sp.]